MPSRWSFLFISSCPMVWGGSEELWAGAAVELRKRGHHVVCTRSESLKGWKKHPKWKRLREAGVLVGKFGVPALFRAIPDAFEKYLSAIAPPFYALRNRLLAICLRRVNPDLVVVCQGNTFDGMFHVELPLLCHQAGKPFALVCQKNTETDWLEDPTRARSIRHFQRAKAVFFVSEHNKSVAEEQLGVRLEKAEIIRNPFMVKARESLPWPEEVDGLIHVACVGRLYVKEKGQDLLLNVLSLAKWRARPLCVNFYGEGGNAEGLREMAKFLGLDNVRFHGFAGDVTQVWRQNRALILPSRSEGLALAQVEAMICGRVPIVCPAGGAGEILENNVTGFLASASNVDALDEAMERAWTRRDEWLEIGRKASESVWRHFPRDPCAVFADKLEALL